MVRSDRPEISVCIVTSDREEQLTACLRSLREQESPPAFEILICANGIASISSVAHRIFPEATVVAIERSNPGAARNVLIERAAGELLLFVDDDVAVEKTLLRRLCSLAAAYPDVAVFGGPNETPADSSLFQMVQGAALASLVGSGPARRRYGRHPRGRATEVSFILCNLAVRRAVMTRFPPHLTCAEESALLVGMRRKGLSMYYDPEVVVFHERRSTWKRFAQQMLKYGKGRGELSVRDPFSSRAVYWIAGIFAAYLVASPLLITWNRWAALPLFLHLAATVAQAVKIGFSARRPAAIPIAVVAIYTIHVWYGLGIWFGAATIGRDPGPRGRDNSVTVIPEQRASSGP